MDSLILNPPVSFLYKQAIQKGNEISNMGALMVFSGKYTGRKPDWKHIVNDEKTRDIWWGPVNQPITEEVFSRAKVIAKEHIFNKKSKVYCLDTYLNWYPKYNFRIRLYTRNPYHALFYNNMTIRSDELFADEDLDLCIYDAGAVNYKTDKDYNKKGMIGFNFTSKEFVILGTEYAGEIKKGLLTYMMYRMPLIDCLTLHSSANIGKKNDVTLFFGLSGTGKTTLSTEAGRQLIGDDEHVWCPEGIFNVEGGCYAKCKDLSQESEPEIFNAIKYGAVVENVKWDEKYRIDFADTSVTENTRCSYPLHFLKNVRLPAFTSSTPKNIIMLCCDTFGLLPPIAKLTTEQAIYFFLNGYTSKVAGTEQGINVPEITFSSCFGEAFLVHHPKRYGELLAKYIEKNPCHLWLLNTGWIHGDYETGKRIPLKSSRLIVDAIHNGSIHKEEFVPYPYFKFKVPMNCANILWNVLNPISYWSHQDKKSFYMKQLKSLHERFEENYRKIMA